VPPTTLRRRNTHSALTKGDERAKDRIAALLETTTPNQLTAVLEKAGPAIKTIIYALKIVVPLYYKAGVFIYTFCSKLPWELFEALIGLGLCFFGGGYCASIAAVEAFRMTGWTTTKAALADVHEELLSVADANSKDDKKDEDGDGVADVEQIDANALVQRKIRVAAGAVRDPDKLVQALGGLGAGWLAVQGVLRVEFAKTIMLAISFSQMVEFDILKALVPALKPLVEKEFQQWIPAAISTAVKSFFVLLAWKVQTVVSAVQSAMRGGLMVTRGLVKFANKRAWLTTKDDEMWLDEVGGYTLAALGFYVQWQFGFGTPFPLSIVMLPFDVIEWYIRWTITS